MYEKLTSHGKAFKSFCAENNGIVEYETVPEISPPMKNNFTLALVSMVVVPLSVALGIYVFSQTLLPLLQMTGVK
jgi:hypothetical protein